MTSGIFPFSWKKCREGADLCLENANRFLQDAFILFENERYVTASCLAIYAIEEVGKGMELLELFKTQKDLSESKWKKLTKGRAHIRKIKTGQKLAHQYLKEQLQKLYSIETKGYEQAQLPWAKYLQWRKEQCLYVDLENNKWTSPTTKLVRSQVILASMELSEAFEGCVSFAKELGRDITDLNKRYDAFQMSSMRHLNRFLEEVYM